MTFIINDHAFAELCRRFHRLQDLNQELMMELTHEDRRERRRKIANACEGGADRRAVGRKYGVSDRLVRMACEEHGVEYRREHGGSPAGIVAIVAGLVKTRRKHMTVVATDTGNSRQRVHQVLKECIRYGLVKATKFGRSL